MSLDEKRNVFNATSIDEKRYSSLDKQIRGQSCESDFARAYESQEKIKVLNGNDIQSQMSNSPAKRDSAGRRLRGAPSDLNAIDCGGQTLEVSLT